MAITGSSLEAMAAGTMPEIIPIEAETPIPNTMLLKVRTRSSDPKLIKERK